MYTITDDPLVYSHPAFAINPAFCLIDYVYEIDNLANGDVAITRVDRQFTIHYTKDLAPLNQVLNVVLTATSHSHYTTNQAPIQYIRSF